MKHILITGGAGFIGSNLAAYYLAKGDAVTVIDNLVTGSLENIKSLLKHRCFQFHNEDLLNYKGLAELVASSDRVFNMAAIVGVHKVIDNPLQTLKVNVEIVSRLLDIIAHLDKKPILFVASSSEVYGDNHKALKESDILRIDPTYKNHSSYPVSKLCNESEAMAYYKEKKVPVVIGRLFNTIGVHQTFRYGMVVPRFVKQALSHEPITIYGDGHQTRSFCDVDLMCRLLDKLMENPKSIGEIVNIGNGCEISVLNMARLIKKVTHSDSKLEFIPYDVAYGKNYNIINNRKPDLTKLNKLTGISGCFEFSETILKVARYYESQLN
jgi:UDP-glucose 4-epimerase